MLVTWRKLAENLSFPHTTSFILARFIKRSRWTKEAVFLKYNGTPLNGHPSTVETHDITKVLTVLPFTSILKQHLNSGHPTTPYNGQLSWSQWILNDPIQLTLIDLFSPPSLLKRCAQQPDYTYHTYRKYTGSPWVSHNGQNLVPNGVRYRGVLL